MSNVNYDHLPIYATLHVKGRHTRHFIQDCGEVKEFLVGHWFTVPTYSRYDLSRMVAILRRESLYLGDDDKISNAIRARLHLTPDQFYIEWPDAI